MKRLLLCLLTAVLLLCGGCGGDPVPEVTPTPAPSAAPSPSPTPAVLRVCVGTEGYTMDPTYVSDVEAPSYMSHLFEGLTRYVPADTGSAVEPMELVLGMAESVTRSEDGLRYTFTIRPDAMWSDGEPVRARDFVYAWQRLFTPSQADEMKHSASAEQLFGVLKNADRVSSGKLPPSKLGVEAKSDRELVVYLEEECSHFLKLCASTCLVPLRQDLIEEHGGDWTQAENLVVNGAFRLTELVHDDHMTLEKNPLYYDAGTVTQDRILWYFTDGPEADLHGYRAGEYDFVSDVTDPTAVGYGSSPRAGLYYLYLNVNNVKNWRVRAAMTLAIDRDAIAAAVGGGAAPAVGMIPPGIADSSGREYVPAPAAAQQPLYAWLSETYPGYDLDTYAGRCDLARKLYDEAVAMGAWYRSYTVYYRFNESTVNRIVAETCRKNWQEVLGQKAEFAVVGADRYAESLENGSFDIAYLGWLPDYNDAQNFLDIMRRGGDYNHSEWGDGSYTTYMDSALTEYDPAARDEIQLTADGMLFTEHRFAVCPVYAYGDTWCARGVENIGHSASGIYGFQYASFTQ